MSNNIFNFDFLEFLKLLEKHEVDFLLVGGYAVVLHVILEARATWIYGLREQMLIIKN